MDRLFWAGVVALLLLHFAIGTIRLDAAPRFFDDEAWESSIAWALAEEGTLRNAAMTGCGGMDVRFVQPRMGLALSCAAAYRIADVGIATCRLSSIAATALGLLSILLLARRHFGAATALGIGLLLVLHPWFFELSRRARPGAYVLGFGTLGLWRTVACLESRRGGVGGGLGYAAAGLSHPIGFFIAASTGLAAIFSYGWRDVLARLPALTLGGALLLLPYGLYAFFASQHPDVSWVEQMGACGAVTAEHFQLEKFWRGLVQAWNFHFQLPLGAPMALITLASVVAALRGGNRVDRVVALSLVVFAIAAPYWKAQIGRYMGAMAPLMVFTIGRALARLLGADASLLPGSAAASRAVAVAALLAYLATGLGAIGLTFHRLGGADAEALFARIGGVVGPDARVYADMLFWLGHGHYQYVPFHKERFRGEVDEQLREADVDYVIRTAWLFPSSHAFAHPPHEMPPTRPYAIDRAVARHGTLVHGFRDPYYGPVEIYRMSWSESAERSDGVEP